ncbi:MAG TPA: M1 family metallopeptidase, partial [Bryobacteraceae bacterium]|nr:M1 family metallopeptidase [Bryobacteraceae bacterium]
MRFRNTFIFSQRRLYGTAAILFAYCGAVFADTYARQPGIDAIHYAFRLTLTDASDEISGEATADLQFVQPGVTQFWLDLANLVDGRGMTATSVMSEGAAVPYRHEGDRVTITLSTAPAAGTRRQFTIAYHGIPKDFGRAAAGLSIRKNKYGERTYFSLNWPDRARQWLPIIDHPSDKATSEFLITAPAKYQVVANGLLQETLDLSDGRRMTHWKQSVPIASWLNAIGVAQFASHYPGAVRGIPLQTWVYWQDRDKGIVTFEEPARKALEFFIDHIGPYSYEKLANVQAAGLGGGTEHASEIFYGETSVTDKPATNLVAHETAHQWFGDSVTEKDWDDVWLSEGFATYFTLLSTEHYEGRDAFVAGLKRSRNTVFTTEARMPGIAVAHHNLADMSKVLNQIVYQKGGWTLHMLRGQIGDEKFWAGIRDYYARYCNSNASTAEFRRVMEENSGADLGWFFDQWIYRVGSPVVAGTWRYDGAAHKV